MRQQNQRRSMKRSQVLCALATLREILPAAAFLLAVCFTGEAVRGEKPAFAPPAPDPARIVGSDQCAKCHQPEVQQWMRTPHFATFDTLHRTPEAKQIADRLGLRSIKRSNVCTQCHYTEQRHDGRVRVVAGVSCESCHGGAADWLALHADYGGAGVTKEQESADHRAKRLADSVAHGMNNPHNLYLIAKQCFNCHTVPNERLVNVGGHIAGSQEFELVAWSQGVVRHNFLRTGGTSNGAASQAELRVMFVVGIMTDLEYSLRAAAVATEKSRFGVRSAERAARMKRRLHEVQALIHEPLIQPALDAVATVELRLENEAAIVSSADAVAKAAYKFAAEADGNKLAALDALLPQPTGYKN
jgi:Cytochrome c554 and c-prime